MLWSHLREDVSGGGACGGLPVHHPVDELLQRRHCWDMHHRLRVLAELLPHLAVLRQLHTRRELEGHDPKPENVRRRAAQSVVRTDQETWTAGGRGCSML